MGLNAIFGAFGGAYGGFTKAKTDGLNIWTGAKPTPAVTAKPITASSANKPFNLQDEIDDAVQEGMLNSSSQTKPTNFSRSNANDIEFPALGDDLDNGYSPLWKEMSGTAKPTAEGVPNSKYTYMGPDGPMQSMFYNSEGKVIFEFDYKPHGMGGPHGHMMTTPGDISTGHLQQNHVPFMLVPRRYFK